MRGGEHCRGVSAPAQKTGEQVRSAELVATLCLATDLGMGFRSSTDCTRR